ncbi:hypothetical protein GQ53DRAFT_840912 [Thozetella sp. PMI_491]|nr:hypothetical protein GQ53DRAFT_840912 [Thozetella sp. PMI_491]
MFGFRYTSKVKDEEEEDLLETTDVSTRPANKSPRFLRFLLFVSILANILFAFAAVFLPRSSAPAPPTGPSYEAGFITDLEPSKSAIELAVKEYSGGVELDRQGNFVTDQGGQEYVGPPSPAVDKAWRALLTGLNLDLGKDEIDMSGWTFQWPESGLFFTGLEVYHSLHCLNRLRQALYPDYYRNVFKWATDPSREDHIGHCINHIRQALQCHADLTPMRWRLNGTKVILLTDTRHTCRNFDRINDWAVARRTRFEDIESWNNGSLVIVD